MIEVARLIREAAESNPVVDEKSMADMTTPEMTPPESGSSLLCNTDCFAAIGKKCTCLESNDFGGNPCPFYKSRKELTQTDIESQIRKYSRTHGNNIGHQRYKTQELWNWTKEKNDEDIQD